jgi:hypothetical protein
VAIANYFLHIAANHLSARLQSETVDDADIQLGSGEELLRLLARTGIVHGLDHEAIASVQAVIDRGEELTEPVLLAAGTPPILGRKSLHPSFTISPQLVEETDENGQIRQVEHFLTPLIRKGGFLTQPGPPIQPQAGTNIFGQAIPCPFPSEQVIRAGDNVLVDEESRQLVAAVSGYPVFSATSKGTVEHLSLGIDRLIRVTPDRMQAQLNLKPPPPGQTLPDRETILRILDEEQIVFGLLPQAIEHCLERCAHEHQPQQAMIALGSLPVNGKDAWLRFAIEVGALPGKIMGNGEIDFRERNMFIGVTKDQLLAHKIPASAGTAGRDVYGNPIEPLPGKDITVRTMDDAALDPATGEIRALRSGVLSMVTENSVKVCSRQVVAQDVDYETGNIFSRDAIEIKGSVKPKFKVNALGDVLVSGDIEKAQVRSDGNVVIKGGVIGKFATVHAHGDIDVAFVVQGRIQSGGKSFLRQHGSYCRLHASGDLFCNPSARIVASQLVASGSITAGNIGSDIAPSSLLAAAVAPEQLHRYFELRRTLAEQDEAIENLYRHRGSHATSEELEELIEASKDSRKQLARLNLIVPKDREPADLGLSHALACTIVITGKVFAGTEIRLGNSRMTLSTTMSSICFRLQEHLIGEAIHRNILAIPYKK